MVNQGVGLNDATVNTQELEVLAQLLIWIDQSVLPADLFLTIMYVYFPRAFCHGDKLKCFSVSGHLGSCGSWVSCSMRHHKSPIISSIIYSNVLFVAELEAFETGRGNISKLFFHDICEPNSCLYLREIPLLPLGWDVPFPYKTRFTHKTYRSFINFGLYIITNQQSDS